MASQTVQVGQVSNFAPNKVQIAPHEQLKSERDEYVQIYTDTPNKLPEKIREKLAEIEATLKTKGMLVPAIGYVDGGKIFVIDGRQRLGLMNKIIAEGGTVPGNFKVLIQKKEDVLEMLAKQLIVNEARIQDTFAVFSRQYAAMKAEGKTNKEIADLVGKSEQWVGQVLRVEELDAVSKLVTDGVMDTATAAMRYATADFVKPHRDKKTKAINQDALKEAVEKDLKDRADKGEKPGQRDKPGKGSKNGDGGTDTPKAKAWFTDAKKKAVLEYAAANPGEVPFSIIFLLKLDLEEKDAKTGVIMTIDEAIKKSKGELNFMYNVDFRSKAERKAQLKETAAKQAARNSDPLEEGDDDGGVVVDDEE